eukprot:3674305-Amphidinium_carterae.1
MQHPGQAVARTCPKVAQCCLHARSVVHRKLPECFQVIVCGMVLVALHDAWCRVFYRLKEVVNAAKTSVVDGQSDSCLEDGNTRHLIDRSELQFSQNVRLTAPVWAVRSAVITLHALALSGSTRTRLSGHT